MFNSTQQILSVVLATAVTAILIWRHGYSIGYNEGFQQGKVVHHVQKLIEQGYELDEIKFIIEQEHDF